MGEQAGRPVDAGCVFCRIVRGEIPCHKVYEDEEVLSFLDVGPLARGHTLVIPKGHWVTVDALPAEVGAAVGRAIPGIARAVLQGLGAPGGGASGGEASGGEASGGAFNILQNNGAAAHQEVPHVHFHIIPRSGNDGLPVSWPKKPFDHGEGAKLAEAIRGAMGS